MLVFETQSLPGSAFRVNLDKISRKEISFLFAYLSVFQIINLSYCCLCTYRFLFRVVFFIFLFLIIFSLVPNQFILRFYNNFDIILASSFLFFSF